MIHILVPNCLRHTKDSIGLKNADTLLYKKETFNLILNFSIDLYKVKFAQNK